MAFNASSPHPSSIQYLQQGKDEAENREVEDQLDFPDLNIQALKSPEEVQTSNAFKPDSVGIDTLKHSEKSGVACNDDGASFVSNESDGKMIHAFYRAVEEGSLDILQEVICTSNCDVNICFSSAQTYVKRKHWGWSALHLAAAHANADVVKYLIAQGADSTATTPSGETALHISAKHGAADVVSFLLDSNIFLRNAQNSKGVTPLLKAVFNIQHAFKGNYRRCVDLLLGAGSNLNISSPSKVTALHIAVVKKDTVLVTNLLAHGANVNAICCQGSSSLLRAVISPVVSTQIVTELLEAGADPSLQVNERSLLHIAVSRCDETIVDAFLRKGADPNCKDHLGLTPLSIAVEENNIKIVPILVSGGGDVNYMRPPQSISLLSQAVKNNSLPMVQLLLRLGASPNTETIMWSTPLHLAVDGQNMSIIKELLRANCPLNTTSNAKCSLRPMTPIQLAMELGNMPVVRLLVQAGCKIQQSWLRSDRLPLVLNNRPEAVQQLHELVSHLPSLLHLCRLKIRECSGDGFGQLISYLNAGSIIPAKIVSYLALSDILDA